MKDTLTTDIAEFAASPAAKILRAKVLSGEIPHYQDEIIEIDRVSVQFRKWGIRIAEGFVGFIVIGVYGWCHLEIDILHEVSCR